MDDFLMKGSLDELLNSSEAFGLNVGTAVDAAKAAKDKVDEYREKTNLSITNFIKKAMVLSKVYIQNSIVDDPSINDNLSTIQNQYLSFILTALELENSIVSGKTIKKMMEVVSTESYRSFDSLLEGTFGAPNMVVTEKQYRHIRSVARDEDLKDRQAKRDQDRVNDEIKHLDDVRRQEEMNKKKIENDKQRDDAKRNNSRAHDTADIQNKKNMITGSSVGINKDTRDLSISSGRIVELTLTNATGATTTVKIPVQLIPVIMPNEVAQQVVSLNFTPSFRQRFLQASAGEIRFFKDLIFNIDLIEKKRQALKKDNTGLLKEIIDSQHNAAFSAFKKLMGIAKTKQNIANSIYVFNKQDFMNFAHDSGLNWRNMASRSKFFQSTFSFMCVLIDPIYAKSEYYWDGFDAVGEYSAKQLKAAAQKDSYDLKDIMAAFAQGNTPRF